MAERDIPGGERSGDRSDIVDPAAGVEGIVSSGVIPNRHRLPTVAKVPHSVPELDDEPSSPEALPKPMSVVSSSSCNAADGIKATFTMSFCMEMMEVAIWRLRV
jgi:hypothetical protein